MSIKLMSAVWAMDLAPAEKLVMLAIADNANDDGLCWPSLPNIAKRTCLSRKTVQRTVHALAARKVLSIDERSHRSHMFSLHLDTMSTLDTVTTPPGQGDRTPLDKVTVHLDTMSTPPGHHVHQNPHRTINEPKSRILIEPSTRVKRDDAWFEVFKSVYPTRSGDQGWRKALKAAHARIAEGHKPQEFIEGAERYAAYVRSTGSEGSQYVKQAATFLGPEKPFIEKWTPVQDVAQKRLSSNISAAEEFMRRTEVAA